MAQISSNADQHSTSSLGDMDEVKKIFDKFDTNGDGKISVSELRSVFKALGVNRTSSEEIKSAMTEIDKDGDGAINLHEFADFHRATVAAVKEIDKDGDSAIDLHEFADFHRATVAPDGDSGQGSGKEISDAFEMYDWDKNGLILAQEISDAFEMYGWLI